MTDVRQTRSLLARPCLRVNEARVLLQHGRAEEALSALDEAFSDVPEISLQTCPAGLHRDWWCDVDPAHPVVECPWCNQRSGALAELNDLWNDAPWYARIVFFGVVPAALLLMAAAVEWAVLR